MLSLAALSGVAPERSKTQAARQRRMPDRLSWAPAVISLAELSGVAPERSDTRAARLRRMPDRLSRAPEAPSRPAINMAAVRAVVDEKRRAMSPADWAKATDDGAMIARGLRALKTLPDPQAAMPAFRRKMAEVGVAESAIASIPRTWDPRLADVVIAAHGEMGKLPVPPSRAPGTFTDRIAAAISGDDRMGDTDFDDGAAYLIGSIARAPQDAYSAFFRAREQRLARERGDTSPPIVDAGPPTDEPIDTEEMYKRLKFDPNGPHYAWEAAKNPIAGAMSYFSKEKSKARTEELVEDGTFSRESLHNGEADAFRHAYWSYLMAQELGPDFAKRITDAYEASTENPESEELMDLYNNHVARQLALDPKNRGRPADEVVLEALRSGLLQVREYNLK